MRDDSTQQRVLFPDVFGKPLVAQFDQPHAARRKCGFWKLCPSNSRNSARLS